MRIVLYLVSEFQLCSSGEGVEHVEHLLALVNLLINLLLQETELRLSVLKVLVADFRPLLIPLEAEQHLLERRSALLPELVSQLKKEVLAVVELEEHTLELDLILVHNVDNVLEVVLLNLPQILYHLSELLNE